MTHQGGTRGRWLAVLIGTPLVLLAGAYLGLWLWQGDRVATGTSVAGVEMGGMTKEGAEEKLGTYAKEAGARPVTIQVGDEGSAKIVPNASGLALDVDASLKGVGGSTANPMTLLSRAFGGEDREGVIATDKTKLADAIQRASNSKLRTGTKDGSVTFEDGSVQVVRSTPGQGVNADRVAAEVSKDWPAKSTYTAEVAERKPRLSNAEIDRFVKDFASPAVSGPLTVVRGAETTKLSPDQIGDLITVKQSGSKLSAKVDGKDAAKVLREAEPSLEVLARNAKVTISGKTAKPVAGKDGIELDEAKLGAAMTSSLTSDSRRLTVPTKVAKPEVSNEDLKGVETGKTITEYRSKFPGGASNKVRTQNMKVALAAINGTVVPAGKQFSLIQTLGGDLTPEKGYGAAPTIQGGKERAAQGGGVSQVSTAMYNAAFFAGVQLDEHKSHSFWIERYPAGREATIWVPHIDNTWTNDTGKPIVVLGKIEGDEVVVTFLGHRKYEVETTSSDKYNIRQPETVEDDHAGCLPVPTNIGFDIDVTRTLKQGGKVVKTEKDTTSYQAANRVRCTNPSAG
ncbi:VanW family protein [Demetria terragena]|uniref:VanW family protein n=1 Tax=Demetria terragena TaxID=63959 RepID=UPI00037302A5|nr:VanW family protein [Demetria terragena]